MVRKQMDRIAQDVYILKLDELSPGDNDRSGSKAANLGELGRAGFPVPSGFVVTTDAFFEFLTANNIGTDSSPEDLANAVIPADIADALVKAAGDLGDMPLAVRSSGEAEDLPGASFAGQYETVLDVRGKDALLSAVLHCWASAFSERVLAYRKALGQQNAGGMAVLVQQLVEADAAGVAFTANPVTGDRATTVVSAVRGLGERLVSGQASPDEWLVRGDDVTCQSAPEEAIDAEQARAIAGLARRVEAHYGSPQDIEWAIADRQLFLLQARPITTLPEEATKPIPVAVNPPPGFWQREVSHAPYPVMPMLWSVYSDLRNEAARNAADEFSLLYERIDYQQIGGWEYIRIVPVGGKDRRPPPVWLMPIISRVVPSMRSRIKGLVETVRSDKAGHFIRLWYDEWKPSQIKRIAELRDIDLTSLTDSVLDEHISSLLSFLKQSVEYHFMLHPAIAFPIIELAFACRDMLGWDDEQTLELLSGLSERSSEPARRLAELACIAAESPSIYTLLEAGEDISTDTLAELDPEFAAAFSAYQHEFGCRVIEYTLHDPTLAETPALILSLIRDQLVRGFDPAAVGSALDEKRTVARDKAHAALEKRTVADRDRFKHALAGAELAYPVREDNEFYTISAPFALVRYMLLELGRRLASRGQIADRDDVFFLELEEARSALREGKKLHDQAAHRKGEHAWIEAHPGPAFYGEDPGPPPSFDRLPAEVRLAMNGFLWYVERGFPKVQENVLQSGDNRLNGIAASAGRYTGPVRVIRNESEFSKLQAGDVLVCPTTSPVWSVLFASVGALITDTGGILSHPAIIAREYQIPAVVATGNATSLLRDGLRVTVDGSIGVIDVTPIA
jgi:pyruvate,water dikinase